MDLVKITLETAIILQNISVKFIGNGLINISLSNTGNLHAGFGIFGLCVYQHSNADTFVSSTIERNSSGLMNLHVF